MLQNVISINFNNKAMEKDIQIISVIGYSGSVKDGLILHPDNEHLLYPLGSTIVIRHITTKQQSFLRGHDNKISVIKVSPNGRYVASGQKTFMGFQADVIVWDFKEKSLKHRLKLHKVLIVSLSFSYDSRLLASQGGMEDKDTNMLIIWDVESGKSLYGTPIKQPVSELCFFHKTDLKLLCVLQNSVQILTIDKPSKKILSVDVNFGSIKRLFTCCVVNFDDTYSYVGSKTGDLFEINNQKAIYKRLGPVKKLFSQGITTMGVLPTGDIVVGAGDGTLGKVAVKTMQQVANGEVLGGVSSIAFTGDYTHFFCGTTQSNIYWVNSTNLASQLRNTCHPQKINDVCFPHNYSDVFASCSQDIRIWNSTTRQELLRIQVPGLQCHCLSFLYDGKSLLSGWSDGKIRAFLPQSGKLQYCINNAHHHGVTSLTATTDCQKIVSGGNEGEVRVWRVNKKSPPSMQASMKEHRGRIWSIKISKNNDQAVSGSGDGTCIIWDLRTYLKVKCLQQSTLFKQVVFHPEEYQLLTAGSDRNITYWEKFNGKAIRKIEGSQEGEINALAITKQGEYFVTGGEDTVLRICGYGDGQKEYQGTGHTGAITKIQISPDRRTIVSVGAEGAIFMWNTPEDILQARPRGESPILMPKTPDKPTLSAKSVTKIK